MTARPEGRNRPEPVERAAESTAECPSDDRLWHNRLACAALVILLGVVYLATLYPGVTSGDSAELQYMCPLLGVCHSPGYAIEVVAGKLFSLLPIGANVAWRINFMQTVCGIIGCLALYGVIRRLTGQILPALVSSTTLAFSIIYWSHSVAAEAYVFYSMFLLLGLYAAVRFVTGDKSGWLYLTALFWGICVGNRPSELLVLPALVGLWLGYRARVHLRLRRIALSVLIALLPFVFSVGFFLVRENPQLLHARDDALRDEILKVGAPLPDLPLSERLRTAVAYCAGLRGAGQADFTAFSLERLRWDLDKYAWLLSGWGALGYRFPDSETEDDLILAFRQAEQGRGTNIGALGVLLAVVGVGRWRRQYGVVLLGLGLFVGNLLFYLYVHPKDNLDFTIPGSIGLAVLIGLGASTRTLRPVRGRFLAYQVACFVVPAFLLVTNYRMLDPAAPEEREHLELAELVKKTPLPDRPVIIATYSRAHTLRCLYWVDAGRTNVRVFIYRERFEGDELLRLVLTLSQRRHAVLFSTEAITKDDRRRLLASWTPRELVEVGLFWAYPRGPEPGRRPGD